MSMGTCISAVHKSKGFDARLGGQTIRIYPVLYFCRYSSLHDIWGTNKSRANLLDARLRWMDAAWGDGGPEYVCNSNEYRREGDWVYRVKPTFRSYVDTNALPGEFIGLLKRDGRKWFVEQMSLEEAYQRQSEELRRIDRQLTS
jgi:hypothetical protein